MTVTQFIEWLKTFPEDTEFGFLTCSYTTDAYDDDSYDHNYADKIENIPHSFYDFSDFDLSEKDFFYKKKILDLGFK